MLRYKGEYRVTSTSTQSIFGGWRVATTRAACSNGGNTGNTADNPNWQTTRKLQLNKGQERTLLPAPVSVMSVLSVSRGAA